MRSEATAVFGSWNSTPGAWEHQTRAMEKLERSVAQRQIEAAARRQAYQRCRSSTGFEKEFPLMREADKLESLRSLSGQIRE